MRAIRDSLAIEGNTLTLDQATTVLEGKRVAAPVRDILELQNAKTAYEALPHFIPYRIEDILKAHRILMKGLNPSAGRLRARGAGISPRGIRLPTSRDLPTR